MNWNYSKRDFNLIRQIVDRAQVEGVKRGGGPVMDRMAVTMDLEACHCNGNPLDLEKLLNAPRLDFVHDVCGIIRHIDRDTGALKNCFVPRCSAEKGGAA